MEYIKIAIKLIVGLSVLNVWLLRTNKESQWRGGSSGSLKEEFQAYGLSTSVMWIVGAIKIILSIMLLVSIFYPSLEKIGAIGMAVMMLGAIAMHFKINDSPKKSLPAFIFLSLSLAILIL